jgi:hypothetical protein
MNYCINLQILEFERVLAILVFFVKELKLV